MVRGGKSRNNPPPALVIRNLTNCPSVCTELPQLQDEPSSHAAQNQQSSSCPIPIPPRRRKGKKKDKGKHKQSPHPCSTCGHDDHPTNECLAPDDSSTVRPSSPGMLIDLTLHSPELQYPPCVLPPLQSLTWTTSAPCVVIRGTFAPTAPITLRPGRAATLVTRSGISLLLATRTDTACTATPGDIVRSSVLTPTAFVMGLAPVQSPPATPYHAVLTPSFWMTLGQTTMDSMMHTMTSTGRHRTTLLECEAGKLHLKKGVML